MRIDLDQVTQGRKDVNACARSASPSWQATDANLSIA
jgi:hypothetical protein